MIRNFFNINPIAIILSLFFVFGFSDAGRTEEATHYLNLKQVIDTDNNINSDYEYGKELYPQYSYQGLSDSFLIKKSPDISISPNEIELIKIRRMPFVPASISAYIVSIHFNPSAVKKIKAYTKRNVDKRIALEIDDKIFVIAKILDVLQDEAKITLRQRSLEEIERELRKISNNVVIDDNKNPEPSINK